jgi:hypothetical protein
MTDDRKSGIALIAGSVGGIITMAMHPVAAPGSLAPEQVMRLMALSGAVHALAIGSVVLLFLGACGLTRRIANPDRVAFSALVVFGFACVALLIAPAVSGFIVPNIMQAMARDLPANGHQWEMIIYSIFQINQAFARIYSVAASLSMILWSVSALRNGGFGRGVAIYGCVIAPLIILGIGSGRMRLDVHGMAAVWLGQAIWFILVGSQLSSQPARESSQP